MLCIIYLALVSAKLHYTNMLPTCWQRCQHHQLTTGRETPTSCRCCTCP